MSKLSTAKTAVAETKESDAGDNFERTERAFAEHFAEAHQDRFRFDCNVGKWYEWTGTHWEKKKGGAAFRAVKEFCKECGEGTTSRKMTGKLQFNRHVEEFAKRDSKLEVEEPDYWDSDPMLLGTPEGTVDLRTGELRPPDPNDRITKLTAVAPAPKGTPTPRWSKFLLESTNGDEKVPSFLQCLCGYTLTGMIDEHLLVFIYGSGGNGKSVFLNTVSGVMHDYAETASMEAFTSSKYRGHPTELAKLHGARLVTATETEEGRAWAEARIKQITGGDKIAARFMRQDEFTFSPQFQLMFSGNHRPKLQNVDDAMRRRLAMIPFENKPKRKDTKLTERLRAEWPGILRWMIDGCLEWQAHGLDKPEAVEAATADYFEGEDIFGQFFDARVARDLTVTGLDSNQVFDAWTAYAKRVEEPPREKRWFMAEMRKRGCKDRKSDSRTVFDFLRLKRPDDRI